MFHVGQKVVCVAPEGLVGSPSLPVRGGIYTVSGVGVHPVSGEIGLNFAELQMLSDQFVYAWRFRPLTDTRQSVSFTTGADPSTDKFDNRRRQKERV